ncbi:MAG: NAD(P)H-dependent oxidoreductase subunit E [Candidatus Sericytochromatia bacterium]|nr:NAD(P)H-dependent oxidoreductase subunit E [Candidatus Sericytochromatia bacterium]
MKKEYPAEVQARFEAAVAKYPHKKAATLTCLWIAQETDGHVTLEAMEYIADLLEIPVTHIYAVVGFYSMYTTKPLGKYHIQVCHTLSCELMGAEGIIDHLKQRLGINVGETTPDGLFTLSGVECLASCGTAPMCQINRAYYENLTPEIVDQILDQLRKEATVHA